MRPTLARSSASVAVWQSAPAASEMPAAMAFADGGEKHVVLALVHVVLLARKCPVGLAFDARHRTAADRARAVRAHHVIGGLVVASGNLAVGEEGSHAVRIEVVDFEVVVDV